MNVAFGRRGVGAIVDDPVLSSASAEDGYLPYQDCGSALPLDKMKDVLQVIECRDRVGGDQLRGEGVPLGDPSEELLSSANVHLSA